MEEDPEANKDEHMKKMKELKEEEEKKDISFVRTFGMAKGYF